MMIKKVSIKNYKCLRDVQVDLERFTIFVGPNASGKSSILQALNLLCERFHINHPENQDQQLLLSRSRDVAEEIELAIERAGLAFRYRTRSQSPSTPKHTAQTQWDGSGLGFGPSLDSSKWEAWKANSIAPPPRSVLLRLEVSKLIQEAPFAKNHAVMTPEGVGLHSALKNMALYDPDSWGTLQSDLRQIITSILRLRFTQVRNQNEHSALLFDTTGANSVTADQVSEGTLLVLGLLATLHASERPSLVLLDDLDRGLHPKAQKELVSLLRGLLETNKDLQIAATTHSPYMLDWMNVEEVRMTFLKDDGVTMCAPLTSHPKFPKWKDEMTPGEMWSLFGEKWITE